MTREGLLEVVKSAVKSMDYTKEELEEAFFGPKEAPPPPTRNYQRWSLNEVPIGMTIRRKSHHQVRMMITGVNLSGNVFLGSGAEYTPSMLLAEFEQMDGSPCGVEEIPF